MMAGIVAGGRPLIAAPAPASGPVWLSTTGTYSTSGSGRSLNVAMPATVNAGDLLVMAVVVGDGWTWSGPAGWTPARDLVLNYIGSRVFYKIASGSEGGTTVNVLVGETVWMVAQVMRIQSGTYNTSSPLAIATANGTSSQPDSPALAPFWGLKNTLWMSLACTNLISFTDVTSYPYAGGNTQSVNSTTIGSVVPLMASCNAALSTGSQDPAPWLMSAGINRWIADTIAVQPIS